ncbi:MAG: isoaspartyl peptidase/L-asparaginase [Hymenobacteraceae bacterium]|nr:isoaspartyl peptidase/L-asparaginase [Hymenobacteraceae bacterium]
MISLALHGGAGTIARHSLDATQEAAYRAALQEARDLGYRLLAEGAMALDVVEATVRSLEDCPLFNAGRGAVFTHEGIHELDASLMSGIDRATGAVAGVCGIVNPISLARLVMEQSEHVLLAGAGAEEFARLHGAAFADPEYFFVEHRHKQWIEARTAGRVQLDHATPLTEPEPTDVPMGRAAAPNPKMGTVGAVARDRHGHLAAATSTGGMTNKRWGRVGDTPLPGAGTWADDRTCAVSCTGHGEFFIRGVVAYDIACLVEYRGLPLAEACRVVLFDKLLPIGGEGGLVAVDAAGNVELPFNSEGMYRAWRTSSGSEGVAIYR